MKRLLTAALLLVPSLATAAAQPPIPNLAQYKTRALQAGALMCPTKYTQGSISFGTYYDGAWAMERLAEQVIADGGNPAQWFACVDTANDIYRDAYVFPNNGAVPGYIEFTTGMRLHYQRLGGVGAEAADSRKGVGYMAGWHLIDLLGRGAAFCGSGGGSDYILSSPPSPGRMREIAYCLRSVLDAQGIGINVTPATKRDVLRAELLSMLDQWIVAKTYRAPASDPNIPASCLSNWYIQPFMLALGAHSLIQYSDATGLDASFAIYNRVKETADWLWDNARVPGQNVFWYQNCKANPSDSAWLVAMPPGNPASTVDLSLFYPSIFQWLYMTPGSACGNTAYRDRADALFSTSVATGMTFLNIDGKHYNQNMTFSREYIRLRSLPEPSCGAMPPGVPGQPTITVGVNP